MEEYVEKNALCKHLTEVANKRYPVSFSNGIAAAIKETTWFPAANVSPRVVGRWEIRCVAHHDNHTGETDEDFYLKCSECGRTVWDVDQIAAMNDDHEKIVADFPYCHCGAKMGE